MLVVAAFILALASSSQAIMFTLQPNTQKCLREEIHKDVLVSGEYSVQEVLAQKVVIRVTDSKDHILYTREDASQGKFAFNTEDFDVYEICFSSHNSNTNGQMGQNQEVTLNTKHGVEAKSYEAIGDAAKLKPMEVELRRLEDLSGSIVKDFIYMQQREEQMRNTNESTQSRILLFSVFSLVTLAALATWQVLYMRKFFKAKKLIE